MKINEPYIDIEYEASTRTFFIDETSHKSYQVEVTENERYIKRHYDCGQLLLQEPCNNSDELDGRVVEYYPNDRTKSDCAYKDGVPHGKHLIFDEDGNKTHESYWENGIQVK